MIHSLGAISKAKVVVKKAGKISAYRHFLSHSQGDFSGAFADLPLTDKKNYILPYDYAQLRAPDAQTEFTLFRSSGSSGQAFFWPQLRKPYRQLVSGLRGMLEASFQIHKKRTIGIVGLALGSWVGGDCFSWSLKNLAMQVPYPFTVFSPGNHHDEIIEIIQKYDLFVDQFLILMCPSAIGHLQLKAKDKGITLPFYKLRYLVLGEPFPEQLRLSLQKQSGHECPILSLYGSADTGTLGVESPASAALRQLFCGNAALREAFQVPYPVPHFFHFVTPQTYIESINQELVITKWQGIPLIRYNLHDRAALYHWKTLCQDIQSKVHTLSEDEGKLLKKVTQSSHFCKTSWLVKKLLGQPHLGDLISITGRSDASLILCGTNLTEEMLAEVMHAPALTSYITGQFYAKVAYQEGRQFLFFDIEVLNKMLLTPETEELLYHILIKKLGKVQPEFLQDWQNVYSAWDDQPEKRILKLSLHAWPALSKHAELKIKHRGI